MSPVATFSGVEIPMPVRISPYHPYTVHLEAGPVRLQLARMSPPQFEAFNAAFDAHSKGRGAPPEDAPLEARIAYLEKNAAWIVEVFRQYVRVVAGDLVLEGEVGGEEIVTDGARFVELYNGEGSNVLSEL